MLPGPVFNVELVTTARRPRYYAFRVVYGLALLVLFWQNYASWDRYGGGRMAPQQMAGFAWTTFASMAVLQAILILAMTPALVAGVIADEKQRKTLHYLLASTLTSGEIVLGKLAARMLHVAVFLAIGLPVMSLLSLFGGVDPSLVMLSFAGSFTTAFFLASLAVLASTLGRKVRDAISMTYALEAAWILLPIMVREFMPLSYPRLYTWVEPVNAWFLASTPWAPAWHLGGLFGMAGVAPLFEATLWMMGLQVAAGIAFVGLAVLRLRPLYQAQEGAMATRFLGLIPIGKKRRLRLFGRPDVGDNAMIWKELHTSKTGGAAQIVGLAVALAVAITIGYWTGSLGIDAFNELRNSNYDESGVDRASFNAFLRFVTTGVGVVAVLAAAVGGANTITSEREGDTWLSLTATPLEGRDVVPAKMIGILWRMRWAGLLLAAVWIVGLVCGAIHPFGLLLLVVENAVFVGFATAMGTYLSLRSKSTWRAQSLTIGVLMTVGGGYLACCCPVMFQGRPNMLVLAGCIPYIEAYSLFPPWEYVEFSNPLNRALVMRSENAEMLLACVVGILLYGFGAWGLAVAAISGYDRAAGRPIRDGFAPIPERPRVDPAAKSPVDPY